MAYAMIISTFKMCISAVHVIFIDPRTLKHLTTSEFLLRKLFASTEKNVLQSSQVKRTPKILLMNLQSTPAN